MNRKGLALLALVASLSGCVSTSTVTDGPATTGLSTVTLTAQYVDGDLQTTERPDQPQSIHLAMPLIPGALVGSVLTRSVVVVEAAIGDPTVIDLSEHEATIAKYATPLLSTEYNRGIAVTPRSTKLVRVGTFAHDPASGRFLGPTGLLDPQASGQVQLFLVYFDGPAVVEGFGIEGDDKVAYHVEAKERGFVWVEVNRLGKDSFFVTNRQSSGDAVLTIRAPEKTETKA